MFRRYGRGRTSEKEGHHVAGMGKKIKEAAMHAAKDRLSGSKKGKHGGGSGSGADRAKSALKKFLK